MTMSKKDFFIALAQVIREVQIHHTNSRMIDCAPFTPEQLDELADFCCSQNPRFMRERWLGYIAGENGPGGGNIRG